MRTNSTGQILIEGLLEEFDPLVEQEVAERLIKFYVDAPLHSNQFSALVPLVMCIGADCFASSALLRLLNAGRYFDAAKKFSYYNYIIGPRGGKAKDKFLTMQRSAEKALFNTPAIEGGLDVQERKARG